MKKCNLYRRTMILSIFSMALYIQCSGRNPDLAFVDTHGQLAVRGTQLVDKHGTPIVLRGMSFGWHNWWPQFWNADVVRWLRLDWQCTILRAAMGIEHEDGYLKRPEYAKSLVKTVVEACIENGIYVIIDWHDHNAQDHLTESVAFFKEMARTYGRFPHVIYEIYNEPDYESWSTVKAYSDTIIQVIRRYDPDNLILVGSPHWDQDVHVVADDPLAGYSNIMYTLHFYAKTHKQSLRDLGDYALKKGLPLFVSEYGAAEASGDGGIDGEEWIKWIDWVESNHISWVKWSISDKEETCSALMPGANPRGNWPMEELSESGALSRALLIEYNRDSGNSSGTSVLRRSK